MSSPIINISGDFTKPVTTLIEKISNAVGILYEPEQIIRKAKAEAEARKITLLNELKLKGIVKRALRRSINEEIIAQQNMESIIAKAITNIKETAKPENIDNDWLFKFFNKSKYISNEKMQQLWARILSGEANNPNTFSRKTLSIVEEIDQNDAWNFQNLLKFKFDIEGDKIILIFNVEDKIYLDNKINFGILTHLDTLGLISFDSISGFSLQKLPKKYNMLYGDTRFSIEHKNIDNNKLDVGKVLLSKYGEELATICESKYDNTILDYTFAQLIKQNVAVEKI